LTTTLHDRNRISVDLVAEPETRIVCGDGAMGTLLLEVPKLLSAMLAQTF
jgi:hypothetical protein